MASTNIYYNRAADYNPDEVADGDSIEAEFDAIQRGFLSVQSEIEKKIDSDDVAQSLSLKANAAEVAPKAGDAAQVFSVAAATDDDHAVNRAKAQAMIDARAGSAGAFNFRNKITDGRFDFWYEGTSQTASGYGSDTMSNNAHSGSTKVHSRQPLVVGVDLPAIDCPSATYFSRTIVTSVAGAANYVTKGLKIENVGTLAGKTVTLSFYAKADAVKNISFELEQYFGTGGSASITGIGAQLVSLSTSWVRYSRTFTIPSISGKTVGTGNFLNVLFGFDIGSTYSAQYGGQVQQSGTFDLACVQLEEGSIATPFEELPMEISQQRVNRYFRTSYPYGTAIGSTATFSPLWYKCNSGDVYNYLGWICFDSKMRSTPAVTTYSQTTGASGKVSDTVHVLDLASVASPMDSGIMFYVNNVTLTYPVEFHWHYKADARL